MVYDTSSLKKLLAMLFDENEPIWWAFSYKQSSADIASISQTDAVSRLASPSSADLLDGAKIGLNPAKRVGLSRAQDACGSMRNLLVEFDHGGSLQQQLALAKDIGLPYTSAVWSGGRSVHFIISLKDSIADLASYKDLHNRLNSALRSKGADQQVGNPGQHTRAPVGHRYSLVLGSSDFSCEAAFKAYVTYINSVHLGFDWLSLLKGVWFDSGKIDRRHIDEAVLTLRKQFAFANGKDPFSVLFKGDEQRLLELNGRIETDYFKSWLKKREKKHFVPEWPTLNRGPLRVQTVRNAETDRRILRWLDELEIDYEYGFKGYLRCPSCAEEGRDSKSTHLSVSVKEDDSDSRRAIFHCHAGCDFREVLRAMREFCGE